MTGSGVVFMVCIPKESEQAKWIKNKKKKIVLVDDDKSMCEMLREILYRLNIKNATWCESNYDNYLQVIFPLESRDRCEEILDVFAENGIGKLYNSVVSVIPCCIHYTDEACRDSRIVESEDKNSGWNRFVSSVRSRLTVAQIVENVKNHASLTFDFICLILISTMLCAIGLVENSNVYLLSSMLISPMMGPVMAGTFGTVIRDRQLQQMGVQNELIGLGIATLVGFCYGSVICIFTDKYGMHDWPTYEMFSRGELRSLWVGCLIALLSGAAVALGVLSDNIASLVGVAISTSLMPPAVNAGLLWSIASVYYVKGNETTRYATLSYTNYYSNNKAFELLTLGAVSICLTFVNIICIYVSGILVLKIKEVAPIASRDKARRHFWKYDIKIARDYNRTIQHNDMIPDELRTETLNHLYHSTDLSKGTTKINVTRSEYTWSPCMDISRKLTVNELRNLYANLLQDEHCNCNLRLPVSNYTKFRRLSQIFRASDEKLNTINELSDESNTKQEYTTKKKFTVTKCVENEALT